MNLNSFSNDKQGAVESILNLLKNRPDLFNELLGKAYEILFLYSVAPLLIIYIILITLGIIEAPSFAMKLLNYLGKNKASANDKNYE